MEMQELDNIDINKIKKHQINSFEKGNKRYFVSFCSTSSHSDAKWSSNNHILVLVQEQQSFSFCVKPVIDKTKQNLCQILGMQKMTCISKIKQVKLEKQCIVLIYHKTNEGQKKIRLETNYLAKIWMLVFKKIILDSIYKKQVSNLLKDQNMKVIQKTLPYLTKPNLQFINEYRRNRFANQIDHLGSQTKDLLNKFFELYNTPFDLATFMLGKINSYEIVIKNQRIQLEATKQNKSLSSRITKEEEFKTDSSLLKQNKQIEHLKRQIQQLSSNLKDKEEMQTRLIQEHQKDLQAKVLEITGINQKIEQLKVLLGEKQQQLREQKQIHQLTINSNQQLKKLIKQYQQEITKTRQENQQVQQKLKIKSQLIKELQLRIEDLQSFINKIQCQRTEEKSNQERNSLLLQQYQRLKNENIFLKQEIQLYAFQGEILHDFANERLFMRREIEKYTKSIISHTKIIFSFDPNNPTSFHKYIDQVQNICVVIKLKNGRLIAGYSASPVSPKNIANKGGLIFSLNQKKVFKLYQGKRSVTYDTFFLIFGNSELRLKHGQPKFFTNFGIANSFFDAKGQKYVVINGEGSQREQILEHFEIFKIYMKQEKKQSENMI